MQNFFKVSKKYKVNLRVAHINFQNVSKKRMQLKYFVADVRTNDFVGISENWLTADDKMSL